MEEAYELLRTSPCLHRNVVLGCCRMCPVHRRWLLLPKPSLVSCSEESCRLPADTEPPRSAQTLGEPQPRSFQREACSLTFESCREESEPRGIHLSQGLLAQDG